MKHLRTISTVFVVIVLFLPSAFLYGRGGSGKGPAKGFRAEILKELTGLEKKIEELAGAVPPEKYAWRPGEGVRSISEVYVHIAGSNYLFPSFIGTKAPSGLDTAMEKTVTGKKEVIEILKKSFEHFRMAVERVADDDLDKPAKLFGEPTTVRDVLFTAMLHMHEHLGQSIAYARINNIVPPWTAAEQPKQPGNSGK